MKGKRFPTHIIVAIVAVLMAASLLLINHTTIFQEGNPLPVMGGILRLCLFGEPYVRIRDEPLTFITKTGDHESLFAHIENTRSVRFKEQMGSGYVFEGDGNRLAVTSRQYSRSFQIWELPDR